MWNRNKYIGPGGGLSTGPGGSMSIASNGECLQGEMEAINRTSALYE